MDFLFSLANVGAGAEVNDGQKHRLGRAAATLEAGTRGDDLEQTRKHNE